MDRGLVDQLEQCERCNISFLTPQFAPSHLLRCTGEQSSAVPGRERCRFCSLQFILIIRAFTRNCMSPEQHKCNKCLKRFPSVHCMNRAHFAVDLVRIRSGTIRSCRQHSTVPSLQHLFLRQRQRKIS